MKKDIEIKRKSIASWAFFLIVNLIVFIGLIVLTWYIALVAGIAALPMAFAAGVMCSLVLYQIVNGYHVKWDIYKEP